MPSLKWKAGNKNETWFTISTCKDTYIYDNFSQYISHHEWLTQELAWEVRPFNETAISIFRSGSLSNYISENRFYSCSTKFFYRVLQNVSPLKAKCRNLDVMFVEREKHHHYLEKKRIWEEKKVEVNFVTPIINDWYLMNERIWVTLARRFMNTVKTVCKP